ncbi:DinB superfamily protein [Hymenobacter mucosus]|uniref:DinB superfamily protein n=2 Tax=Hymenobacteraceae TaxID=1853232 RepID=A0A238XYL0_9BACT|nr:DinB superfamily protein [Hymenobacter mucosus]
MELEYTPAPGKWSRKETLGHLIDSATNNHLRFVQSQTMPEPLLVVPYPQEQWVRLSRYQHTPSADLLHLWQLYNQQLARLLENLPAAAASHRCEFDNGYGVSLQWLAEDYAVHMEHHIQHILSRV